VKCFLLKKNKILKWSMGHVVFLFIIGYFKNYSDLIIFKLNLSTIFKSKLINFKSLIYITNILKNKI
jgi:hypothetical protein